MGRAAGETVPSGTLILDSATGALRGFAGPVTVVSSRGAIGVADGRATGPTGESDTLILDSANGAARGRAGPFSGTSIGVATVVQFSCPCGLTASGTLSRESTRGAARGRFGPAVNAMVVSPT